MKIDSVELRQLALPLNEPLRAAHGVIDTRPTIIVGIEADGHSGWGECVALADPGYLDEWSDGEYEVLRTVLAPALLSNEEVSASGADVLFSELSGHRTAKAAVEMALLDAELRAEGMSLAEHLGSVHSTVPCCIVIGLGEASTVLAAIEEQLAMGYGSFKLKVTPASADVVAAVRATHPDIELRLDANASFDWEDPDHRKALERFAAAEVDLIEQPLAPTQNSHLAHLRKDLGLSVTLDESITSTRSALEALENEWIDVMTVKPGPLGGLHATRQVHGACLEAGIPLSLGGMIDSGLSRAFNLAVAAMPGFVGRAAEVSPDGRWFTETLLTEVVESSAGCLAVPNVSGIGADLSREAIDRYTLRGMTLNRS